jgi:hypothetical protein
MEPEIKITRIGHRWHARLMYGDKVQDEMACELRVDIGYICRTMMRWDDKTGGGGIYASKSRDRLNSKETNHRGPVGKIWYQNKLHG